MVENPQTLQEAAQNFVEAFEYFILVCLEEFRQDLRRVIPW